MEHDLLQEQETLFLYHINDLHSHFSEWSQIAYYLEERREEHKRKGETMLVVDIGDHMDRSHILTEATMGKVNIFLLNDAEVSYATIGNNEGITLAKNDLYALYDEAQFQVLVCNLFDTNGERPHFVKPYAIYEVGNQRIGFIGATVMYDSYFQLGWDIRDPQACIEQSVKELKEQGISFIVLLSHLGEKRDEQLAKDIPTISLILGGHTHHYYETGRKIGATWVGAARKYGMYIGGVKIHIPSLKVKQLFTVSTKKLHKSKKAQALLTHFEHEIYGPWNQVVTYLQCDLPHHPYTNSVPVQLLLRALMEWSGTNYGVVNAGIILRGFQKGELNAKAIHEALPHPINPAKVTIQSRYIKQWYKESNQEEWVKKKIFGLGFRGDVLGITVLGGLSYDYEADALYDTYKDRYVHETEALTIVTLDMFTFGPLFPYIHEHGTIEYYLPEFLRDVFHWYMEKRYEYTEI